MTYDRDTLPFVRSFQISLHTFFNLKYNASQGKNTGFFKTKIIMLRCYKKQILFTEAHIGRQGTQYTFMLLTPFELNLLRRRKRAKNVATLKQKPSNNAQTFFCLIRLGTIFLNLTNSVLATYN